MHLHFIFPRWKKILEDCPTLKETISGRQVGSFQMAGLGIPAAAAAVPEGHVITLVDEHIEAVDYGVDADLVCLSFFTPQATNAYAIAERFRARGRAVLAGGIHPTMATEDTLRHVDAVLRGPVEGLWERILADLQAGRLQRVYEGSATAVFSQPRRELFRDSGYLRAGIVQTARGCDMGCPFCVVPRCNGPRIVFKPVEDVIADIQGMPFPCFYFADENLLFHDARNHDYRNTLLKRMIEERIRKVFFLAAYPFMLRDLSGEDLDLLVRAGCRQIYLVLGLAAGLCRELPDPALVNALLRLRDAGMETMAAFTLGNDADDPERVEEVIARFSAQSRANLGEFTIFTPFPGTADFERMRREG
ncbi:MAG: hypothetical protein EOM20_04850, partial [Spartobacteria bacterium]|nr:hypothetical protein [Spartobacteria bacterium]